jgi:carbamoyl-phosphate synthase small subunit
MSNKATLIFEDGTSFPCRIFSGSGDRFGEVVFNTAMTGYQEVLTDPSYCGQMVVMTYPLIGNYGIQDSDWESKDIFLSAFLVKEYCDFPSHFNSQKTLKTCLEERNILGVEGLDTRAITRHIRTKGAQRASITTLSDDISKIVAQVKQSPTMEGQDLASKVSTDQPYIWQVIQNPTYRVAVIDCGVKFNILRILTSLGCECHVFPNTITSSQIKAGNFQGLFISNGPGDPEPVIHVITLIKELLGTLPIFGICLGHQLLGLALGGKTYKLPFGHHGANHPVKNLLTEKIEITSQNHGFCLDINSLPSEVEITHINLNDHTLEGIRHKQLRAFSVQYHPEAAPGPNDPNYLFNEFITLMKDNKNETPVR